MHGERCSVERDVCLEHVLCCVCTIDRRTICDSEPPTNPAIAAYGVLYKEGVGGQDHAHCTTVSTVRDYLLHQCIGGQQAWCFGQPVLSANLAGG